MKTTIKNQSPFVITIAMLALIALIILLPTETLLNKVFNDDFKSEWVDRAIKMGLLFLIGYSLIRMLKIQTLSGLSRQFPWRFKYLNLIPVYLIIIGILSVYSRDLSQIALPNLILLLFGCLMVGFAEEYLFRGLLQSLFLKKYGSRKNGIFMSILFSSVFFGAFHLINLTNNDNSGQVLIQVVFAMFIGFFFGVLVLKTNKLIPVAITHGLINFFFSLAFLPSLKTVQDVVDDTVSIAPIILTLPLFIIGLLIYRKLDKKEIIEKLEIEN
ncbi:MAG: hypothetical protein DA407_00615 [Bacteroidetes bacterium]|nr:MAG: hypothetical protein DA407_00615 [Bacteroidota bacterium]